MLNYSYGICNRSDKNIYTKQRDSLLANIPGLNVVREYKNPIEDNDICVMRCREGEIMLLNSITDDEVLIRSEFDIEPFFR